MSPWAVLTGRGRALLLLGALGTVAGVVLGQHDIAWLGLALLIAPLLAYAFARVSRLAIRVRRTVEPALAPVGSTFEAELVVDSDRDLTGGLLLFEEALPAALGPAPRFTIHQLTGGGRRVVRYAFTGRQRGRYVLGPLRAESRDAFGLVRLVRGQAARAEVLVTPRVHELRSVLLGSAGGSLGEAAPQHVGAIGEDDVLVREYRRGDDVRRVHWRSTAKHGELMVRREEQSWDPSATVVVDTRIAAHAGSGPESSFEWLASMAASVAVSLVRRGFRVDLVDAAGAVVTARVATEHDLAERELIEYLTDVQPVARGGAQAIVDAARGRPQGQLVVALLGLTSRGDARVIARLRGPHSRAVAVLVDAPTFAGGQPGAEAEAQRELAGAGWTTTIAVAGSPVPLVWGTLGRAAHR